MRVTREDGTSFDISDRIRHKHHHGGVITALSSNGFVFIWWDYWGLPVRANLSQRVHAERIELMTVLDEIAQIDDG